jgi:ribosome-associated protein
MSDPLYINEQVEIPGEELIVRTSRSTGAGGQHANVTDSRVEVSFDIASSQSLPEWARSRLLERIGSRVTAVAQDNRSQLRNRELARSRLAQRLRAALDRPRPRRPTRPGPVARGRRLDSKRRQSQRKQERRPPAEE